MADLPAWHNIELGQVGDAVRLAADGLIPADAGFTHDPGEDATYATWFGYRKTDDEHPSRVWVAADTVSFAQAKDELAL